MPYKDLEKKKLFFQNYNVIRRQKRKSLKPLVYAWFDSEGIADWVGHGTTERARQHKFTSPWYTPQHLAITMTCDSEWQAMEYEGKWGARYRPRYNVEGYRR